MKTKTKNLCRHKRRLKKIHYIHGYEDDVVKIPIILNITYIQCNSNGNFSGYFGEYKFQNLESRIENVPQQPTTFGKQLSSEGII